MFIKNKLLTTVAMASVLSGALLLSACGDDSKQDDSNTTTQTTTTDDSATTTDDSATTTDDSATTTDDSATTTDDSATSTTDTDSANLNMASANLVTEATADTSAPGSVEAIATGTTKCDTITPISMFFHFRDRMAYDPSLSIVKYIEKHTCTKITSLAPKYASKSLDVFNLHLASGHIADVIGVNNFKPIANKYGIKGDFYPLDTLFKYAPNIKRVFDTIPDARLKTQAADGHIYYLPYFNSDKLTVGRSYFIRKDWLDKLKLPIPKTVDELEKTLIAFRDQDPNGNGRKDEIPYCGRHWQEAIRLVNLFGSRTSGSDYYFDMYAENNKVHYAFVEPKFKEAYKHVVKWYKDKLIDPQIFTRGKRTREILFSRNQCGMVHDWVPSTTVFNTTLQKKIPGFHILSIDPPVGTDGKQYEEHSRELVRKDGWGMSAKTKDPIAVIKFLDWFYSPVGLLANNYGIPPNPYGIKPVTYTFVDGKATYNETTKSTPEPSEYLYQLGITAPMGYPRDDNELQMLHDEESKEVYSHYRQFLIPQYSGVAYTADEQRIYDRSWSAVNNTIIPEYLQKWMLGTADIDATWDEYISKIKETGFMDMLKVTQTAYDRTYHIKK